MLAFKAYREFKHRINPGAENAMKLMALIIVLFSLISFAGFLGALLFGATGATLFMVLGLCVSFVGIAFFL